MIEISKDKSRLNVNLIYEFLSKSYWGKGRAIEQIEKSIANSICFGVYLDDDQIGFARVISDGVFMSFLMDVFVLPEYRGKGYSKELMQFMLGDEELKDCKKWMLRTADAHGLYQQFGFTVIEDASMMMEKINNY